MNLDGKRPKGDKPATYVLKITKTPTEESDLHNAEAMKSDKNDIHIGDNSGMVQ